MNVLVQVMRRDALHCCHPTLEREIKTDKITLHYKCQTFLRLSYLYILEMLSFLFVSCLSGEFSFRSS